MSITFLINEGQRVETAVCDSGLGGKTLTVSVKEFDPASGDDVITAFAEFPYEAEKDIVTHTKDFKLGMEVTVTVGGK